jgi:hypothetical protein
MKKIKVIITEDSSSEMLQMKTSDDKCLFEGNYWDFITDSNTFKILFEKLGIECNLVEKPYDEWYEK